MTLAEIIQKQTSDLLAEEFTSGKTPSYHAKQNKKKGIRKMSCHYRPFIRQINLKVEVATQNFKGRHVKLLFIRVLKFQIATD